MRILIAVLLSLSSVAAIAQDKTVKFIVGFPAGAGLDAMTRLVADRMRAILGQPVIVENRPGAAGQIAMNALKAAAPDGLTLVMTPLVTVVTAPHVQKLAYDPFADFAPVAHTADFLFGFAVGPNVPAKTLAEFIALVKKEPRHGNYASAGAGSLPHFFSILFAQTAGINMTHIPYKGTAPALTDLVGGQISSFMGTASDLAAQHRAGKLRIVATSGAARARMVGDAPTFKELGFNIEGAGWYAAYAPAKTPKETVDRLAGAIVAAIKAPDIREKLEALGMEPTGLGPEDLARIHRMDFDKWGPVIKASGFKPD
ncbi:MAG: tripartite tricarboxylate transporter substrate-binding protein [Betaproteobacteria bacterium]